MKPKLSLDKKLDIARMLGEGASPRMIAKVLDLLPGSVYYQAKILVEDGVLELTAKRPAQYQKKQPEVRQVSESGMSSITPTDQVCLLKHFIGTFALSRKPQHPELKFNEWGKAYVNSATHRLEVGRYAAKITLKSFVGRTLGEQRINGTATIRALGQHYGRKYGVPFAFLRIYEDVEVLVASPEISGQIANAENLSWGEKKPVAKAEHKAGDSSDPDNLQINRLRGESATIPEVQGAILENILFGDYEKRFELLAEQSEKVMAALEKITEVLTEIKAWKDLQEMKK